MVLLNYGVLALFFIRVIPRYKTLIIIFTFSFYLIFALSFTMYYSMLDANPMIRVATSVSFLLFSLLGYFEQLKKPTIQLSKSPVFWVVTGIFIFSSVTLLRNIFLQFLVFDLNISAEAFSLIYAINILANITKNFILFYALVLIDKGYPDTLKPTKAT